MRTVPVGSVNSTTLQRMRQCKMNDLEEIKTVYPLFNSVLITTCIITIRN